MFNLRKFTKFKQSISQYSDCNSIDQILATSSISNIRTEYGYDKESLKKNNILTRLKVLEALHDLTIMKVMSRTILEEFQDAIPDPENIPELNQIGITTLLSAASELVFQTILTEEEKKHPRTIVEKIACHNEDNIKIFQQQLIRLEKRYITIRKKTNQDKQELMDDVSSNIAFLISVNKQNQQGDLLSMIKDSRLKENIQAKLKNTQSKQPGKNKASNQRKRAAQKKKKEEGKIFRNLIERILSENVPNKKPLQEFYDTLAEQNSANTEANQYIEPPLIKVLLKILDYTNLFKDRTDLIEYIQNIAIDIIIDKSDHNISETIHDIKDQALLEGLQFKLFKEIINQNNKGNNIASLVQKLKYCNDCCQQNKLPSSNQYLEEKKKLYRGLLQDRKIDLLKNLLQNELSATKILEDLLKFKKISPKNLKIFNDFILKLDLSNYEGKEVKNLLELEYNKASLQNIMLEKSQTKLDMNSTYKVMNNILQGSFPDQKTYLELIGKLDIEDLTESEATILTTNKNHINQLLCPNGIKIPNGLIDKISLTTAHLKIINLYYQKKLSFDQSLIEMIDDANYTSSELQTHCNTLKNNTESPLKLKLELIETKYPDILNKNTLLEKEKVKNLTEIRKEVLEKKLQDNKSEDELQYYQNLKKGFDDINFESSTSELQEEYQKYERQRILPELIEKTVRKTLANPQSDLNKQIIGESLTELYQGKINPDIPAQDLVDLLIKKIEKEGQKSNKSDDQQTIGHTKKLADSRKETEANTVLR